MIDDLRHIIGTWVLWCGILILPFDKNVAALAEHFARYLEATQSDPRANREEG